MQNLFVECSRMRDIREPSNLAPVRDAQEHAVWHAVQYRFA
jgi:hypothetical protein